MDVYLLADECDLFEDAFGVGLDVQVLELGEQVFPAFFQPLRHSLLDHQDRMADFGDALPEVANQGRAFNPLHLNQPAQGLGDDLTAAAPQPAVVSVGIPQRDDAGIGQHGVEVDLARNPVLRLQFAGEPEIVAYLPMVELERWGLGALVERNLQLDVAAADPTAHHVTDLALVPGNLGRQLGRQLQELVVDRTDINDYLRVPRRQNRFGPAYAGHAFNHWQCSSRKGFRGSRVRGSRPEQLDPWPLESCSHRVLPASMSPVHR